MAKKRKINEFRQERIDYAKQHKTAEKQLLPIFRRALRETVKPVKEFVAIHGTVITDVESLINKRVWEPTYQKAFMLVGMKTARYEFYRQRRLDLQVETKASAIDLLVDVWTSILRDYALTYTYQIQRELNDTTIKIIQEALDEANALGIGPDGAIRLFNKTLDGKLKLRSLVISRTEATTISNLGKDIGARGWLDQQQGESYKVWLGRNDNRERPAHLEENNTLIQIEDTFNLDGELCQRPGDIDLSAGMRINCRCSCSYLSQTRYNSYLKRGRIVGGKLVGAS